MDWTFDPVWPLPLLILIAAGSWLGFAFLAWRSTPGLSKGARLGLLGVRSTALALVAALLLNPGRWVSDLDLEQAGWALLLDRSASMEVTDAGDRARSAAAVDFARRLLERSRDRSRVTARTFAEALGPVWQGNGEDLPPPSEAGTRLDRAGGSLLDEALAGSADWTGILVLTDGRQTGGETGLEAFSARARALGLPVHVVPFGGEVHAADAGIFLARRQFVSLPSQEVHVGVKVKNEGLPPTRFRIRLLDPAGEERDHLELEGRPGETSSAELVLPAGSPAGDYRVEMERPAGDERPANDAATFSLRLLDKRTRVLLVEGSPYWDTKFLAQLLREQELMDVEAIYRIQAGRYYRVSTGDAGTLREAPEVFPETDAELGRFDLVVLGKGAEAFLDDEGAARLGRFVRQRGGALLFSRGKPYSGELAGLASLEPGQWGEEARASYRLVPTGDGEESGLFGERLPARDHPVWTSLSPLEDVRALAQIGPFTRVLAVGERVGGGARVPLVLARRHGRGMVAAVNGDGIWRWGFQAAEEADWHREFWMHLLQWTATYSEFLPGESFSLHLSEGTIRLGETSRARIGWRGETSPEHPPELEWQGPAGGVVAAAEAGTAEDGTPRWGALLSPTQPGNYRVTLRSGGEEGPSLPLSVLPPPREGDERSADPETLSRLADATGGSTWSVTRFEELLTRLEPEAPLRPEGELDWKPLWNQVGLFVVLAVLLSGEWALRRRFGLL